MTLRPRPKQRQNDVDAVIRRGGSVAGSPDADATPAPSLSPLMSVQLRLRRSTVDAIDALRAKRSVRIPRHQWLLEAIAEKITLDSDGG